MIDLTKYNKIYFIGIGGISMSGIAVILKRWDFTILGSDRNESPQTDWLKKQGIEVYIGHNADNIKSDIELVVFTAAIKNDNPELIKAKELGIPCIERGKFLGELTKLYKDTIGVAGTHGKTSTTSMLALSFVAANYDPSVQVGAFLKNLKGNYRIGSSDYFIVEACEYNDSYLNFKQRSAIVLNVDDDHLDYFKNLDNIQKSFEKYVSFLPEDGFLVLNRDDERCFELRNHTKAKVISVGSDNRADWYYKNVTYDHDGYPSFELYHYNEYIDKVSLKVLGKHNVFNSLCCIAMCDAYGISIKIVKSALLNYTGAVRRLQYKGLFKGAKVYDDYGHHPTEIKATYDLLGLKTFFTSGEDECRAWTFKDGMKAPECAGIIHTDFQKGFIKAEVTSYNDLKELGSEKAVQEAGKLRIEGKEYLMQDGDICFFRFNVTK